jgi:hypothetical protein
MALNWIFEPGLDLDKRMIDTSKTGMKMAGFL